MNRRGLFGALFAGAGLLASAARAQTASPRRQRVVYHLDEPDRIAMTIRNIQNHVEGTGGPGGADLALVVIGPALASFRRDRADGILATETKKLVHDGVAFYACARTMNTMSIALSDLLPGFFAAEKGGVVRLAELQSEGFAYIRP